MTKGLRYIFICMDVMFLSAAVSMSVAQVQDTVSPSSVTVANADGSASVTIAPEGSGTGCQNPSQPYSITNRPPANCPFYGNNPVSLSPWPLPIDIKTASSEKAVNGDVIGT